MFVCQKQNNKKHYKKSKLYGKLINNILEKYRMLGFIRFFRLLFGFMLRIFWNNKT